MGRTGARGGTDGSLKIQRTAQNRGGCVVTFLGLVRSDVFQVGSWVSEAASYFFVVRSSSLDRNCTNPVFFAWLTLVRRKQAAAGWVRCYWTEFAQKTLKKLDEPLSVEWKKERNKQTKKSSKLGVADWSIMAFLCFQRIIISFDWKPSLISVLYCCVWPFVGLVFLCFVALVNAVDEERRKLFPLLVLLVCLFVCFSWCSSLLPLSSLCFNTIL